MGTMTTPAKPLDLDSLPLILKREEVARLLRVSERTVRRRGIPTLPRRGGERPRYSREVVRKYLEGNE